MMIILIAGGRDFIPRSCHWRRLDGIHFAQNAKGDPITEVVSGKASGADKFGETWADTLYIPVKPFPPDWERHGKYAGPKRNAEMARYLAEAVKRGESCLVILFPGGRGTQSMFDEATKFGLDILDLRGERKFEL